VKVRCLTRLSQAGRGELLCKPGDAGTWHDPSAKEKKMSGYTDYIGRQSERYRTLERVDEPDMSWEEGYVPLYARHGPAYAKRAFEEFQESLTGARKRVRMDQVVELLHTEPEVELLRRVPFGVPQRIEEIAGRESRIVLLGQAGAGKSTALRYLASHPLAAKLPAPREEETEELVTVVVDLPRAAGVPLPQYLAQDAQQRLSLSLSPEFFDDLLSHGRAILCLDGLSEIPTQEGRTQAIEQIESWLSKYPRCRYIVTARPDAYAPGLNRDTFAHYVLVPWSEASVEEIEQAWNKDLDGWTIEEAERPFYAQRHQLWQQLALAMHLQGRLSASLEEAQEWLVEAVSASKVIKMNRRRAPAEVQTLLTESEPHLRFVQSSNGQITFAPRLLQDILAARALEATCVAGGIKEVWASIEPHLSAPNWQQTLVLAHRFLAADHPDLWEQLVGRGLEHDQQDSLGHILHRYLLIASSALAGPANDAGEATRRSLIDALFDWMTDTEAAGRQDVVNTLLELSQEPYVLERALQLVADNMLDEWSREAAVLLAGAMGQDRPGDTVEALETVLDDDQESERMRTAATTALGFLGRSGALDDDLQAQVEERLIERIRNAELAIGLRVASGEALHLLLLWKHDDAVLETLETLARGQNEEEKVPYSVQIGAARGLSVLLPTAEDEAFVERMWQMARDEEVDDSVRCVLAETLGQVGDAEEAARVLLGLARNPKVYPPGQRDALEALGRVGEADQEVVDEIVEIAETQDRKVKDFVRLAAAHTLGELGYPALSVQHMLMLVADKSIYRTTRNDALNYLGDFGPSGDEALDDAVVSVLQIWATEENTTEDVRERAMDALLKLQVSREDVIRDLIGAIQDKKTYPRVRRSTAEVLYFMPVGQRELVVEALSPVFYDPEETSDLLRVPIARMLYNWGEDEHALTYLRDVADRSYMAMARYKAAMVLGDIGELEVAAATLLKLIDDPEISDVIRCDSLRALGLWVVDDEEVAEALTAVWEEEDPLPNVREAAYVTLKSITAV
jgi:hypothetical protein